MIVIGTAGHIDHGKSAIVKRLTGSDPDRLPEERERGMTIDLGFAFYDTASGETLGLVDVPGHERFVKNMVAGAGGIDAVMLVIAADDGWMPQSEEHFQITRLLGVKHGLVVINKIDLVESDWLGLLEEDIRGRVAGSFLAEAPVCRVSAQTGEGFDNLKKQLEKLAERVQRRQNIGKARLYIDRSFVLAGIGGVVTGTLRGGYLSVGQSVTVWPGRAKGKVRTLHSHNQEVDKASPGQRTAVSFTGVERSRLVRGGVISDRADLDFFRDNPILALSAELLHNAVVSLTDRRRVMLIVGTTEMEGEIRLLEGKKIAPSQTGVVFFKPDEPVYTLVGDHYILRLPSPMLTLGGGAVLDHLNHLPRRKEISRYAYLLQRLAGTGEALVRSELVKHLFVHSGELLDNADIGSAEIASIVKRLVTEKIVGRFNDYLYDCNRLDEAVIEMQEIVEVFLGEQPHVKGLLPENISRLVPYELDILVILLDYMIKKGILTKVGEYYNPVGRGMSLKGVIKEAHDNIMAALTENRYTPPALSQLAAGNKVNQQAIKYILDSGEGYKCGSDFLFLSEVWTEIVQFVRECLEARGEMAVGDLRDRFGLTRRYAIPIFEETDRRGLTARKGDVRIKGEKFES